MSVYKSYATNSARTVITDPHQPENPTVEENHDQISETSDMIEEEIVPSQSGMKFFTFMIGITALVIASCAAYFSVSGLATLFAGAFWSIVIMGGILEAGKLVATSFLYRFWNQTSKFLKIYLMFAVFVLMIITSLGIFGYLSRAHIEQQGNIQNATVIVQRIDSELNREQNKIELLSQRIQETKSDSWDMEDSIKQQESIRDNAWSIVQSDIDFEQTQIDNVQSLLKEQLDSLDAKYKLDLEDLNNEQNRIENELQLISQEERGIFSKNQNDLKQQLRAKQSDILTRKDELRFTLQSNKDKLAENSGGKIKIHQDRISEYRQQTQLVIDAANEKINDLRKNMASFEDSKLEKVKGFESEIEGIYSKMDALNDDKFEAESKVRLVEAEVGPIKYVAEAVYGDSDNSTVEKAVRILTIMIVFVFDPLAVALVLAYNSLIMQNSRNNVSKKYIKRKTPVTDKKENIAHRLPIIDKIRTKSGVIKNFQNEELAKTNKK